MPNENTLNQPSLIKDVILASSISAATSNQQLPATHAVNNGLLGVKQSNDKIIADLKRSIADNVHIQKNKKLKHFIASSAFDKSAINVPGNNITQAISPAVQTPLKPAVTAQLVNNITTNKILLDIASQANEIIELEQKLYKQCHEISEENKQLLNYIKSQPFNKEAYLNAVRHGYFHVVAQYDKHSGRIDDEMRDEAIKSALTNSHNELVKYYLNYYGTNLRGFNAIMPLASSQFIIEMLGIQLKTANHKWFVYDILRCIAQANRVDIFKDILKEADTGYRFHDFFKHNKQFIVSSVICNVQMFKLLFQREIDKQIKNDMFLIALREEATDSLLYLIENNPIDDYLAILRNAPDTVNKKTTSEPHHISTREDLFLKYRFTDLLKFMVKADKINMTTSLLRCFNLPQYMKNCALRDLNKDSKNAAAFKALLDSAKNKAAPIVTQFKNSAAKTLIDLSTGTIVREDNSEKARVTQKKC